MLKNLFTRHKPPTYAQICDQMYNETVVALLEAEATLERAQATRDMLAKRAVRLATGASQGFLINQ